MPASLQHVTQHDPVVADLCKKAAADPAGWDFFELKTQLNARFTAADAHRLFGELLASLAPQTAWHTPLLQLCDVAADQAFAHHIHSPAKQMVLRGAPLPDGQSSPKASIDARSLFVAGLKDVTTYGRSNLRRIGDRFFSDIQGNEAGRYATQWWFDPMISAKDTDGYYVHVPQTTTLELDEAIDLTGAFSLGWGHCVLEFSPQLLMAETLANVSPNVPILVDADLPQACYDLLRFVSGKDRPMIKLGFREAALVGRLWAGSSPEYWPVLRAPGTVFQASLTSINPGALAELLKTAPDAAAFKSPGPRTKRYYLARGGRDQRFHSQDTALVQFEAAGFEIIYPEKHSFADQFSMVQHASHIAGPWGSQLMLALIYGPPDLRVLIFHQPELEERPGITEIAQDRGQHLLLVPGVLEKYNEQLPYNSLYSVTPDRVKSALDEWL